MDAFRTLVNGLAREFQEVSVGHDYSTVVAAHLTVVIGLILDVSESRPDLPPDIIALLQSSYDVRENIKVSWDRHDSTMRRS